MLGIIPGANKTFDVEDYFDAKDLIEGKLYVDRKDGRVYYYSTTENRSSPKTGYFPVWDGRTKYITPFSKEKYLEKDVIATDINTLCSTIDKNVAATVRYNQRKSDNDEILHPLLADGDNMFTQCVKGAISNMNITMVDLIDMASPPLNKKVIENYYAALSKITFMRLDKWTIWINSILHVSYQLDVFRGEKKLLSYSYPENVFDTGIVHYESIAESSDDPFKKIIKILMVMENISKNDLKADNIDDYTINNMMTTLNGTKSMSAQLFSRFIRMAGLSYSMSIFDREKKLIFKYNE